MASRRDALIPSEAPYRTQMMLKEILEHLPYRVREGAHLERYHNISCYFTVEFKTGYGHSSMLIVSADWLSYGHCIKVSEKIEWDLKMSDSDDRWNHRFFEMEQRSYDTLEQAEKCFVLDTARAIELICRPYEKYIIPPKSFKF